MAMMTARKVLIELLRHEGVEYVFGIPGATEILFMDALEGAPDIHYILAFHVFNCRGNK
jgi:thiamine pyrophosphate-dependent acetolactate synthase large subunit-like protein